MNPEKIIGPAILHPDGTHYHTLPPYRHGDLIEVLAESLGKPVPGDWVQGFVTSRLRFVDRIEAFKIAVETKQLKPRRSGQYNGPELYSEDLW